MIPKNEIKATKEVFNLLDRGASEKECIDIIRKSKGWPGFEPVEIVRELAREHYCAKHSTAEEFLD